MTKIFAIFIIAIITMLPVEAGRRNRTVYAKRYQTQVINTPFINYPPGDLKTYEEIKSWVNEKYRGRSVNSLSSDVSPRSDVWIHLTRDHGWSSSQVSRLNMTEALYLHDASHLKSYFPRKEKISIAPVKSQDIIDEVQVRIF